MSGKVTISEKIKICKKSPQKGAGGHFFLVSQLEVCGRQISGRQISLDSRAQEGRGPLIVVPHLSQV